MRFIANWLKTNSFPLIAFLVWRSILGLLVWLAAHFNLPLHPQFPYYLTELANHYPRSLSSFAFFDGIHYLRLAEHGYVDTGTQAFFPLFPLTIRFFHQLTHFNYLNSALLLTSFFSLLTLIIIYHTFNKQTAKKVIFLLLTFPTSFFFASVYTESLFLLLFSLWIYFLKKYHSSHDTRYMILVTIVSAAATATRITGLALSLATTYIILKRLSVSKSHSKFKILNSIFLIIFSSSGLFSYVFYLWYKFNDPLMFLHVQSMFGANRASHLVSPLRTLWRYFKILITATPTTILYWRALAELLTFLWGLYLLAKMVPTLRRSAVPVTTGTKDGSEPLVLCYSTTSVVMLLLSSFTGTLSSMPRYFLTILPPFYIWARLYHSKTIFYLTLIFLTFLQLLCFYLFATGTFVS